MTSIKEMERVYSFSQGARMGNCSKEGTGEGKWELVGQSFQHDLATRRHLLTLCIPLSLVQTQQQEK